MELQPTGLVGDSPNHRQNGPLGRDLVAELFHLIEQGMHHLLRTVLEPKHSHARVEHLKGRSVSPLGPAGGDNGEKEKGQVEQKAEGSEIEQAKLHAASPR
jgi:hypothetical protein